MPVSLNSVASLVSQLESMLDNSIRQITAIEIRYNRVQVQLDTTLFLTEFVDYEITTNEKRIHPYELTASISGVVFFTLLDASEIVELKTTIPSQWEYIQRKLQKT